MARRTISTPSRVTGEVAHRGPSVLSRHPEVVLRPCFGEARAVGVDDDLAAIAVDDHDGAHSDVTRGVSQADDGGKTEGLSQDRRVARRTPLIGGQGHDAVSGQRHRVGRADRLRDDDDGAVGGRSVRFRRGLEQPHETLLQVTQVPRPVPQVAVFDGRETRQIGVDRRVDGEGRGNALRANPMLDLGHERRVVHQHRLRVQDRRVAFSQGGREPGLQAAQLLPGVPARAVELLDLRGGGRTRLRRALRRRRCRRLPRERAADRDAG